MSTHPSQSKSIRAQLLRDMKSGEYADCERLPRESVLAEKLGIDVLTIINIENFRGNPKFEVLYPLVTTLRIPPDRIFYPKTDSMADSKQQLFWELHSLRDKEALELLPVILCLADIVRKPGAENL